MDELHLMLRVGVCCSETSSYMPTAGTMLAKSIEEKMPTASSSWNKPFGPVGLVSRYGRNGSQLKNQSPVALIGQRKHKLQVLKMLPEKMSVLLHQTAYLQE